MPLGFSAVTSQAWASMRAAAVFSSFGVTSRLPPARQSLTPSHTRYAAPIHFNSVKRPAEAASSAPTPSIENVMAVKSPSATPTAMGSAVRQPWPSA